MKSRFGVLLLFFLLNICFISAQNEVNYKHKALLKELQKAGITDFSTIKEIALSDSVYKANRMKGKYFLIKENNLSQYTYIYVGRVNSCRGGGCSISKDLSKADNSEFFDYFILYDKKKTIKLIKVIDYQATHGHEITAKGWLKQFVGYNGSEKLEVNKNIDAISGATISVNAITLDVEMKTALLKKMKL